MIKLKKVMQYIVKPHMLWAVLLMIFNTAALAYIFITEQQDTIPAYIIYTLTTYSYIVFGINVPSIIKKTRASVYKNKLGNRYMTDIPFQMKISLYSSLSVNLFYAGFKLITGIIYSSFWFGAEAVYYILLSAVRLMLLRNVHNDGGSLKQGFQAYRFCGVLLFALNAALTGIVFQMIHQGKSYEYPGLLIYAAAIYAFFCFTLAVINAIKFRNYKNPVMSAAKTINLAKALVAMFALQTAMFVSFNDDKNLEQMMNSITGGCVCLAIFGMAVFMVVRANKNLKKLRINNLET